MPILLNIVYGLISIVLSPMWIVRLLTGRHDAGGVFARLRGVAPDPDPQRPVVWLHGASVGELLSLQPLIHRLQQQDDRLQFVISAYTRDGLHTARQAWPQNAVFYLPFDLSWSVRRTFRTLNPRLLVLSELELWPNLLLEAGRREIPVAVVSSRMNDSELAFYRRFHRLLRPALQCVHWWGAQTPADARKIESLDGTSGTRVKVTGSLKFDATPPSDGDQQTDRLRQRLGLSKADQILVAGSTHDPEEALLLSAFQKLRAGFPRLNLILVPRHPQRAPQIEAQTVGSNRLSCRRSSRIPDSPQQAAAVTIIDELGQLTAVWPLADVAFVGGSLTAKRGGQNMIEPALLGRATCFGPHVRNFQQAADGLLQAGGARMVASEADLVEVVSSWLHDPDAAAATGSAAREFALSCRGAADVTAQALLRLL